MASEEDKALISLNSASLRIFLALSAVSDHSRTMQLLFSLCNDFDRFTRLVYSFADKGLSISCSTNINVVSNEGIGKVRIDFGKAFTAPMKDDPACRSMQIYLTNEQPDLSLIELILSQEGMICEKLEEADLIACVQIELEVFSERHPRKVVIDESELISRLKEHLGINQLRAIVDPYQTPVPQLPDHLRPCWAKLRKRCVTSIDAGLDLFSEVVSTDPLAGDALLGESCLYDSVIKSLSNLPSLRLRLDGYVGINLTPLVNLTNLKALVLDRSRLVTKAELQPVLGMNALEYLHFAPGSVTELGGCTFAKAGKIAKLKLQLMTL